MEKERRRLVITPFRPLTKKDEELIAGKAGEIFGPELQTVVFAPPLS